MKTYKYVNNADITIVEFEKSELSKMNNDRRCFDSLEDFKKRVEKAEDPDDCI